jgi:hypothetical protein
MIYDIWVSADMVSENEVIVVDGGRFRRGIDRLIGDTRSILVVHKSYEVILTFSSNEYRDRFLPLIEDRIRFALRPEANERLEIASRVLK